MVDLRVFRALALEMLGSAVLAYAGGWTFLYTNKLKGAMGPASDKLKQPSFLSAATSAWIVAIFAFAGTGIEKVMLNPMATLALMLTKQMRFFVGLLFIVGQMVGAFGGAALLKWVMSSSSIHDKFDYNFTYPSVLMQDKGVNKPWATLTVEGMATLFLVLFVLFAHVQWPKESFVRVLAIGLGHFIGIASISNVSGGSLGPLRVLPFSLVANNWFNGMWVYFVGPFIGMFIAIILCSIFVGKNLFGVATTSAAVGENEKTTAMDFAEAE